jgi:RNA polymerase sigma factor (sigma-70 family)
LDRIATIIRCQNGDPEAFEELYKLHCEQVLKTAYLISGEQRIAEDITQEAFIHCFKNIKSLRNPETFNSWFYRILVRCGWRITAKYQAKSRTETLADEQSYDNDQRNSSCIEECFETQETYQMVQQAVKRLSLPLKTVIILHYYDNMSIQEISSVLDCFQGTVKSRLHNARKLLGKELGPYVMNQDAETQAYQRKGAKSNG